MLSNEVKFLVEAWDQVLVVVDHLVDPVHHQQQFQCCLELNFHSLSPSVCTIGNGTALLPPFDVQSLVIVVTKESFVVHVICNNVPMNLQSIHPPNHLSLLSQTCTDITML